MIVVKIGGSIAHACQGLIDELATRHAGEAVLVHGFGPQTDAVCQARGIEVRTLDSPSGVTSRFTDARVLDAMHEAAQRTQARLVDRLAAAGATPEPLGLDVPLFWAEAKPALPHERDDGRVLLVRGNRSGRVQDVAPDPVQQALAAGVLPVVTPLAMDEHGPVSVDADRAAAALAGRLEADALVLASDVPGLLEDPREPASRIDHVPADAIDDLVGDLATGGMARKLVAAREALDAGVDRVLVGDGRGADPLAEMLTGEATEVTA